MKLITKSAIRILAFAILVGILCLASATLSFGQGFDRVSSRGELAAAGYIGGPEFSDDIDGNGGEYFYKLKVAPGQLTVTFEVTANGTAGAALDVFDSSKTLVSLLAQAKAGGSESAFTTATVDKAQDVVIRVKTLTYGTGGDYSGSIRSGSKGRRSGSMKKELQRRSSVRPIRLLGRERRRATRC
jgi:hypothetical protein